MVQQPHPNGPGKRAFDIVQRIITTIVSIVETRLRLIVIELEEEKATLIQLLIIAGTSLIFIMLALISLLALIFFYIDPAWRLPALTITTVTFFLLAFTGIVWTLLKVRRSLLLNATRQQLAIDRILLEKNQ